MPSPELPSAMLSHEDKLILLKLARDSIWHGLNNGRALEVDINQHSAKLREKLACFVTLNKNGALRGCIGHLEATQPLVKDVAENAFSAAFRDPRFSPISKPEMTGLEIHISILSPSQPMEFSSEEDLIAQLCPGVDGLILKSRNKRGTFLPSVWDSLPDATSFLQHLKLKAGLTTDYWSKEICISRYTTESFSDSKTNA